jgi:anti-sigma regulatory factor (Ser/Thr protein kinase)
MPVPPVLDVRCSFPATQTASSSARRWLVGHLRLLHVAEVPGADAELVLGELVSNVLLHTDARAVDVRLTVGETVTVAVFDDAMNHPVLHDLTRDGLSGRGMQIVESLAQAWGVTVNVDRKAVWARLPCGRG